MLSITLLAVLPTALSAGELPAALELTAGTVKQEKESIIETEKIFQMWVRSLSYYTHSTF